MMKTFKAIIATAVVTLSASMSFAGVGDYPTELANCKSVLAQAGFRDDAETDRACKSGFRNDGGGYAACMLNMTIIGLPLTASSQFIQNQKVVTAAEVCAQGTGSSDDSRFINCAFDQANAMRAQGMQVNSQLGETAVRNCVASTGSRMYRPQNQLTNGATFQRESNEVIEQRANHQYNTMYREGSAPRMHNSSVPSYPSRAQQVQHQQAPAVETGTSDTMDNSVLSDLPSVE
ncbi:hypothetical protein [Bdellovibrio sp. HCB209]|uniref:hypothetical protein n=1 Tax=Bdellovibrio sp. HCB209 TaxID=3394354 RepID=UPI0039B6AE44